MNHSASIPADRTTMNGKPVIRIPSKAVINFKSAFLEKLLCDGLTFSTGSACAYSCAFCYVPAMMARNPHWSAVIATNPNAKFEDVVMVRDKALETMRDQLTTRGKPRFPDPTDTRVIYSSPLVDVAANMDLVRETIEACKIILELTHWNIRLLSKSSFLPMVDDGIPEEHQHRMIYGVSTGTMNDGLSLSFERGTPKVSKRVESIRVLQDRGRRTFGMLCPSLPLPDGNYDDMAERMALQIRVEKCEHVWAEVINVRGESMTRTVQALRDSGYDDYADALVKVSRDRTEWEAYARATFEAHTRHIPAGKLRFLQYVNTAAIPPISVPWWKARQEKGAVLL